MLNKKTMVRYRGYSRNYIKNGPWNIDSLGEENINPSTIVSVKEMKMLHNRILRLLSVIEILQAR